RNKEAGMEQKQRELKLRASREMQKEVEYARKQIKEIVSEVKNAPADEKKVQEARKKLALKKQDVGRSESILIAEAEAAIQVDRTIREGDLVRILDTSTSGEVESVNAESVVVRCGNFRLTTSLKNLEKTSKTQAKKNLKQPDPSRKKGLWTAITGDALSTRVDLRGLSGDESIMKIERFIDTMRLNRIYSITIVHGKGTGSLRQRTAEFLQQHRFVKSFRLGEWGEGGAGVTVVELE
ncbi:MAG: Smr/MutS family protein, partial [Chlorobiales bacterium]|nr:Smr/MutS family protein [Chlorobiales bacterium]